MLKKLLLLSAFTSIHFAIAADVSPNSSGIGPVGMIKIDKACPSCSYFRFVSTETGAAYGFDHTTATGKAMLSLLLTAKQMNRSVKIWTGPIYSTYFTEIKAVSVE